MIDELTKDKLLFTPGPLTTSMSVKQAMLRDLGSRDYEFITVVNEIRNELLRLGRVEKGEYEAIIMQGSGTFGIESVIASAVPQDGKLLIAINGEYGKRIKKIADTLRIDTVAVEFEENVPVDAAKVLETVDSDARITTVAVVHCETTTGIMNDLIELGEELNKRNKVFFVDAMSSFGAVPIYLNECFIDYLVSSSNKCIEGVPGFSFILAKKDTLIAAKGNARSVSFDILAQWEGLEKNGQFRFTPPTHSLLAFRQALKELEEEGGVEGRAKRYYDNYITLIAGMENMGFEAYIAAELRGYIITSFKYPENINFEFSKFYTDLNDRGFVIYPGKLSQLETFRIGNIGKMYKDDIYALLGAISEVLNIKD